MREDENEEDLPGNPPAGGAPPAQDSVGARIEESREEARIRQTQRMEIVGRLAGGIAHDFNNLLTSILSCAEILAGKLPPGSSLLEEVEEIRRAGESASALTRQLLAFSRPQVRERRILDINRIAESIRKMLRRILGEDITLVTLLEPGLGSVRADSGQLEQVLMNLAANARDAMPRGGALTIETKGVEVARGEGRDDIGVPPGSYVLLAVSDTGVGMDAATRSRVFEPFFTTKETGRGTGLGLAIVSEIVKEAGGAIWMYSEPGRGTTFKIYLPRVEGVAEIPRRTPKAPARGTETVLVVEDDPSVRTLTRRVLASYGYRVIESAGSADAADLAATHPGPLDLVLTDVVMPDIGGSELAARIQKLRPNARVLFMSGYTDAAAVQLGLLAEKGNFLQKPFTPADLAAKIREVLDS